MTIDMTNEVRTIYETIFDAQKKARTIEHLKHMYNMSGLHQPEIAFQSSIKESQEFIMTVYDKLVPMLFADSRIQVMTLPCDLVYDYVNKEMVSVVAKMARLKAPRHVEQTPDTIDELVNETYQYYMNLFNVEERGEGNTPNVVLIYHLLIPTPIFSDPDFTMRAGYLTRYAMRRFAKKDELT